MSLIKLNLVKFTKQIAYEAVEYSPELLKYMDCLFVVNNNKVSCYKKSDAVVEYGSYFITLFNNNSFGDDYWHLRLNDLNNVRYKPFADPETQYNNMLYNLNLVIEFIKSDLKD